MSMTDDLQLSLEPDVPLGDAVVNDGAAPDAAAAPAEPAEPQWARAMADAARAQAEAMGRLANRGEPQPQAPPQMSQQELAALNETLAGRLLTDPLGVIAPIAQRMAAEQIDQFRREAQPYIGAGADAFIDRFKSEKRESDPLYKHTVSEFDKALEEIDTQALIGKSKAERNRELNLQWQAAQGRRLAAKAVVAAPNRPPGSSAGGGTSLGSPVTADRSFEVDDGLKRQLYASLGKEEAEKTIAEIERGEANYSPREQAGYR